MAHTARESPVEEALIVRMLDNDAFDKVLECIDGGACLPVWLTCKAFNARRPAGTFTTSVCAVCATPAMLDWAIGIGLQPHAQAGAIAHLVALLRGGGTGGINEQATGALRTLVAMLSGGGTDAVKEAAACALRNLAFNNADNQVNIAQAGATAPLVALLSAGGTDGVNEAAAGALANLASNADNTVTIAQAGATAHLVALLTAGGTDGVKVASAGALRNLAMNDDNEAAIVRAGAIAPLVALLSGGGTDGVKEVAASALRNLSCNNAAAVERAGAIAPLVALSSGGGTDGVKEAAAMALRILSRNNEAAARALRNLGVGHRCTHRRAANREPAPMRIGLYEAAPVAMVAAELRSRVDAAEVAAASLLAAEEAEKATEASKKARSKKKKQLHKQQKGGSHDQPPSRGARVAGRDADEEGGCVVYSANAADAVDDAETVVTRAATAAAIAAATAAARRVATEKAQRAAKEARREQAELSARWAGAEEAAALGASLRQAEQEARTRAAAAAAEQERQMAMARAAAEDPPNVIEIRAAELQQALHTVGAQGEVGQGGFGKVFAAELPSLPGWGRVAIKLATSMDPSALLQEVQLLRECHHPNVLPLLCFCGDARAPCMVTPLMRGGSLDDRLLPSPGARQRLLRLGFGGDPHLSWQQRLSALCDAARGLAHLHASCTLHRDVKTGNILLDGSLQPLQTADGIIPVYRAFLSDVGLAKVREVSAMVSAMTHATTSSVVFSTGFCDPIFINSNQHSERTDAYGIGVSLLMILLGEPANGLLTKWEDEGIADFVDGDDAVVLDRLVAKAVAAAGWPPAVTYGLVRVVHGLSVARKSRRQPLPCALDAMEALLQAAGGAAHPSEPAPAHAMVREEGGAGANGRNGGLTRLVGALDRLAIDCGSDAALMRMQKHVNAAFLSMMTRLEAKYIEQGNAPLPCELSEYNKINTLAPRHACPKLNGHAHTLRIWWNAAKHDRGRWVDPPSDRQAEEVAQGVMSELARLSW
jgi:hypothetical protein